MVSFYLVLSFLVLGMDPRILCMLASTVVLTYLHNPYLKIFLKSY